MSNILSHLGIDSDKFTWQSLSLCQNMETRLFYEDYESSEQVALMVDELCMSCPVLKQCLRAGIEGSEHGVWGGVYLSSGKPDTSKNSHKTEEFRQRFEDNLNE